MANRCIKIEPDVSDIIIMLRMMKIKMDTCEYKKDVERAGGNYIEFTTQIISGFENMRGPSCRKFMKEIWPEITNLDLALRDLKKAVGRSGVLFLDERLMFRKLDPRMFPNPSADAD